MYVPYDFSLWYFQLPALTSATFLSAIVSQADHPYSSTNCSLVFKNDSVSCDCLAGWKAAVTKSISLFSGVWFFLQVWRCIVSLMLKVWLSADKNFKLSEFMKSLTHPHLSCAIIFQIKVWWLIMMAQSWQSSTSYGN